MPTNCLLLDGKTDLSNLYTAIIQQGTMKWKYTDCLQNGFQPSSRRIPCTIDTCYPQQLQTGYHSKENVRGDYSFSSSFSLVFPLFSWLGTGLLRNYLPVTNFLSTYITQSVLRPLMWVANVPCKFLLSTALFIWSCRFVPVQSLRSSIHVRTCLPPPLVAFQFDVHYHYNDNAVICVA